MLSRILVCVPTLSRVSIEALENKNYLLLLLFVTTDYSFAHFSKCCVHSRRCTCKTDTLEKVIIEADTRKCNKYTHASSWRLYLLCLVMDISYLVLSTRAYRRILSKMQDAKCSTKSERLSPFT